jgi:DNA topoisomerase-1
MKQTAEKNRPGMNLVIVESPAKAKTINKYLGSDYQVLASYGHVRDLPSKDGSVKPDEDFSMSWQVGSDAKSRVKAISDAMKASDTLILATDPDREGEAISWHVLEILNEKKLLKDKEIQRVVFNAITKSSILEAMKHPRTIDQDLVEAYLARRALDYLVGFTLSPVLWRKLPGSRSAGRVQSVSLRLVCDRELEIEKFIPQEYWTIEANLKNAAQDPFVARLWQIGDKKVGKFDIADETRARTVEAALLGGQYAVATVDSKPQKRNPQPPFTTSTLQQEASRKLGFSSARTMQVAQRLYEGIDIGGETQGLITYMRTDGVQLVAEAIDACREVIGSSFGQNYLPEAPRVYKTKAKNAQEAHEAIRPTELSRTPKEVEQYVDQDLLRLYELIWKRAIASQMESATFERTTADITTTGNDGSSYTLRATGSVLRFDGFLKLYQEGTDDDGDGDDSKRLPPLSKGEAVSLEKLTPSQHFTEPPPRYTEATLIKKMEELGIGRPSTYTSTLTVLRDRGYVRSDKNRLIPEDKGRLVIAFLESFFARYVEYDFTANLEQKLDGISNGEINWKDLLRDFWKDFSSEVDGIADLRVSQVLDALNEVLGPHIFPKIDEDTDPRACPSCENGRLSLKVGRFGAFIGCSDYPECRFTRQLADGVNGDNKAPVGPTVLGLDPTTGREISLHDGRFGPYVQLALEEKPEEEEPPKKKSKKAKEKPKRSGLPRGVTPDQVTLEFAISLLSLPRDIGMHPESGKPIVAGLGRYGPFVQHERTYANLESFEEVFTVGLNRAVTLIAEKAQGARAKAAALKELGEHPELGGAIEVMNGRYGPYVKHGKINATLPKAIAPEDVTLEQAVAMIAEKAAKGGKAKPKRKRKSAEAEDA